MHPFLFYLRSSMLIALSSLVIAGVVAAQDQPPVTPDVQEELSLVRGVLSSEQMQRAMAYIESAKDETLQEFIGLCNAHGPSQDEGYRSEHLRKLLLIYGLKNVHIDDELNVIGIRRGVGDGPTVVLNAHHDNIAKWSKDQPVEAFIADDRIWCPAASDDLIGTVQVLTIIRALNAANIETEGDLWFVFFTNEEPPFFQTELMGSLVYAKACKAAGDDVVAMLSLEMLGYYTDEADSQHYPPLIGAFYPDEGNFLAFIANPSNSGFNGRVHRLFEQASTLDAEALAAPEAIPGIGFSDQWSFWQVGYPGVMVTDTAFMRNHHYHETTDTVETLDFDRFTQATNGIIEVTSELASSR